MSSPEKETGEVLASMSMRVGLGDVDGARLVYFAAPAIWSERLMSEWMAGSGHPMSELFEAGIAMPVASTQTTFISPLRQDELIELELRASRIGDKSFTIRTEIFRAADRRAAMVVETTHVYAEQEGTAIRTMSMPDWLRAILGEITSDGG